MTRTANPPRARKTAELAIKHSAGCGTDLGDSRPGLYVYPALQIYANRDGFLWLSKLFQWMADRPITADPDGPDPGDHVHLRDLRPPCLRDRSDQVDVVFDTLNVHNRNSVLRAGRVSKSSRRVGSPIRQFNDLLRETFRSMGGFIKNNDRLRKNTMRELETLISNCQEHLDQLRR
ncbi:MAG: hypothetical protein O3C40_32300 [Planctomycetota bacterium]|nr:hypothetical protein [Planctomycetota bacterium]